MSTSLNVAPIPLGRAGLNGSKNMAEMSIESLIVAENITYENGVIEKEGGAKRQSSIFVPVDRSNPKNFDLESVVWNGNIFCAVGDADGTDAYIVTSPDGVTWTERSNPKNFLLSGVAWNGSLFVAVGNADGTDAYIVTSTDGITWTERSNPKSIRLRAVTWNGSLFVAVGDADGTDAYIVTSPDGITWTERSNPKNIRLLGIVWNGSLFVAVGNSDGSDAYIITSADGITWTERSNPKNTTLRDVSWNGELFAAVGDPDGLDAYIVTSNDGINWFERINPKNFRLYSITSNSDIFYAVGAGDGSDSYSVTSADGITWVEHSNTQNNDLFGITWNGVIFVAAGGADGSDAYIITIGMVQSWTERSNDHNIQLNDCVWDGNQFVSVGETAGILILGGAYIVTSPDGITWTTRGNPKNFALNSVAYNGNILCAVGDADGTDAYIVTSTDGITWTERSNPANINLNAVIWAGNQFVAVGDDDSTDAYIVTSPDAITWTERSNAKAFDLNSITHDGSQYVAVGDADGSDAYIVTSPDGITWTERSNGKNFNLYGIAWSGLLFCAVGEADGSDAYIVTSPDGITWTERENNQNVDLNSVIWNGNIFFAVGVSDGTDAYMLSSDDGITWHERANPKSFDLNGITWSGELFLAVGDQNGSDAYILTAENFRPSILGGHDWNHDGSTQRSIVLLSDGSLLKDAGTGSYGTILASSLTTSDVVVQFTEAGKEVAANNKKLFIFTGKNQVQVLSADGSTTSSLSTPAADWSGANQPYFGVNHENRVFAGGNDNDPHRIYYSTENDHEDFTGEGSGSISIYPGQGQRLVGAISFKEFLVCFKYPTGIYAIDMTNPTFENWKVRKISEKIGAAWYGTIEEVLDDIVFIDQTGEIRTLTSIDTFADVGTDSLSDLHEISTFIRENLSFSRNSKWRMQYYSTKKELHIAVTTKNSAVNDARLVIDFNRSAPRFRYSTRDICVSLWTRLVNGRPELMSGDNNSTIYRLDQPTKSKDDTGYLSKFQTPHIDLGDPVNAKNGKFLELAIQPKGDHNLSIDIIWDGVKTDTKTFNMTTTASLVSGPAVINKRRKIVGSGTRFSMVCYNSGADQDFAILGANLHYSGGGEDTKGTQES